MMAVFGLGNVICPPSRSTSDNGSLALSVFPYPPLMPSSVMALSVTGAESTTIRRSLASKDATAWLVAPPAESLAMVS